MDLELKLNFELVWAPKNPVITEGPQWDGEAFRFTLVEESAIFRYFLDGKVQVFMENTNMANGTMFDKNGNYFACEGHNNMHAIVRYDKDKTVVLADKYNGDRLNMPNDLAIDSKGRIWFTDPWYETCGGPETQTRKHKELTHDSVYRLDPALDGSYSIHRVVFDTTRPNGIVFSKDEKILYIAQSGRRKSEEKDLRSYAVGEDGSLLPKKVLYNFWPNRGIDGMKLDIGGNIWATAGDRKNTEYDRGGLPPGPKIIKFSSDGKVLNCYPLPEPVQKPNNCAFGGKDFDLLLVTTSAGHLYLAKTNTTDHLTFPK